MRDPKRIDEMMSLLTEIWKSYPDMRFNQLINSLQYEYKNGKFIQKAFKDEVGWGTKIVSYPDLFYVEDDDFIEFLKEYLKEKLSK